MGACRPITFLFLAEFENGKIKLLVLLLVAPLSPPPEEQYLFKRFSFSSALTDRLILQYVKRGAEPAPLLATVNYLLQTVYYLETATFTTLPAASMVMRAYCGWVRLPDGIFLLKVTRLRVGARPAALVCAWGRVQLWPWQSTCSWL